MSPSSSRPPTPPPPPQKPKNKKRDTKGKKTASAATHDKVVGTNRSEYAPPTGAVLINAGDDDAGDFDWDAVNDDKDVELWLIRVPASIKPKHLTNLAIDAPPASSSSAVLGSLKRKYATFDVWSVAGDEANADAAIPVGGEELRNISCLLPRKRKNGRLYPAPKPFAHHLVLAAQPVKPTPPSTDDPTTTATQCKNPSRYSHSKELLKHRFMPCGSLAKPPAAPAMDMDVDMEKKIPEVPSSSGKEKEETVADAPAAAVKKGKKRKVEVVIDLSKSPNAKKRKQARAVAS